MIRKTKRGRKLGTGMNGKQCAVRLPLDLFHRLRRLGHSFGEPELSGIMRRILAEQLPRYERYAEELRTSDEPLYRKAGAK